MITTEQKSEYLKMYCDLCRKGAIDHNLISMGNLAFFVDRCLLLPKTKKLKVRVLSLIESRKTQDRQELFLIIAQGIHYEAKRAGMGENLDFRLKRIEEKYASQKLTHFDILLDDFDFPEWFQSYIPFIEETEISKLKHMLISLAERDDEFRRQLQYEEFDLKSEQFLLRIEDHPLRWQNLMLLVDAVTDKDYIAIVSILDFKIQN